MLRNSTQPAPASSWPSKFLTYEIPSYLLTRFSLPEAVDDQALEAEVTRHFSKFGVVFVKIRRDPRNMPFAFCQFTVGRDEAFDAFEDYF